MADGRISFSAPLKTTYPVVQEQVDSPNKLNQLMNRASSKRKLFFFGDELPN